MHVALVSPVPPFPLEEGPIVDLLGGLGQALLAAGHQVTLVTHFESTMAERAPGISRRLQTVSVPADGDNDIRVHIQDWKTPNGLPVVLLGGGTGRSREPSTFAPAALRFFNLGQFDVMHGFDMSWTDGDDDQNPRVTTCTGLDREGELLHCVSFLPGSQHDNRAIPLPVGIDTSLWNPATDPKVPSRYDPMDLEPKRQCKATLQRCTGLKPNDEISLLGIQIASTAPPDLDFVAEVVAQVSAGGGQVVVCFMNPEAHLELRERVGELAQRYPRHVAALDDDGDTVHELLAASDYWLEAGQGSPWNAGIKLAQRYGVLPITHGPTDVIHCDPELATGTGFVADSQSTDSLIQAVKNAMAHNPSGPRFRAATARVMRLDHGWASYIHHYERLYAEQLGS